MASFKYIYANADFQDKTYLKQIEDGFYERWTFTGASSKPSWATSGGSTAAGDDIQLAALWKARQDAVGTLIARTTFVKPTSSSPPAAGNIGASLQNLSSIPTYANEGELWSKVTGGASTAGPRRVVTAGTFPYGKCQAGDILGHWLIADLQLALKFMVAFGANAGWATAGYDRYNNSSANEYQYGHYTGSSSYNSGYYNFARADHDASSTGAWLYVGAPRAYDGRAYGFAYTNLFGGYSYTLHSYAEFAHQRVTGLSSAKQHKVTTFLKLTSVYASGWGFSSYGFDGAVSAFNYARVFSDSSWQTATSRTIKPKDYWDKNFNTYMSWPSSGSAWWKNGWSSSSTTPLAIAEYQWGYQ